MHYAVLFAVALAAVACSSKTSPAKPESDAGVMHADDVGKTRADAAAMPADASTRSTLERASLPRPPSDGHLPAELRPPR